MSDENSEQTFYRANSDWSTVQVHKITGTLSKTGKSITCRDQHGERRVNTSAGWTTDEIEATEKALRIAEMRAGVARRALERANGNVGDLKRRLRKLRGGGDS